MKLLYTDIRTSLTEILTREAEDLVATGKRVFYIAPNSLSFEKDYSSKGEGRGLGLYKIQQLLEKYPKTTVSTKSSNYRFTQSLTFWKE